MSACVYSVANIYTLILITPIQRTHRHALVPRTLVSCTPHSQQKSAHTPAQARLCDDTTTSSPWKPIVTHLDNWNFVLIDANNKNSVESWWHSSWTEHPTQSMLAYHSDRLRNPCMWINSISCICHRVMSSRPRIRQKPQQSMAYRRCVVHLDNCEGKKGAKFSVLCGLTSTHTTFPGHKFGLFYL